MYLGLGYWPSWYYFGYPWSYPQYYYPPAVAAPVAPPVYIERNDAPQSAAYWWYYCAGPQAYYPYVTQCPGGWQRVSPVPPS